MAHFDLAIIGSGSGNSLITHDFADWRVALIESGTFGGTCLNVGCIPTKMFVYTADVADTVRQAGRYGIDAVLQGARWADIRDRVFGRVDPVSERGAEYRRKSDNVTLITGHAEFDGPRSLVIDDGTEVTADQIVVATGARPVIPPVIAESGVPYETSDTVMRLDELPQHLIILGGGYIAAEFAHVFSALGAEVTIVTRGPRLLTAIDEELSTRFTELARPRWNVHLSADVTAAHASSGSVTLELADGDSVSGDLLLVATGRTPNSDRLNLEAAGIRVREDGRIKVDDYGRTTADGVWSLGDVSSAYQLKHVANSEARTVAHNLVPGREPLLLQHKFVPSAVFTDPQLAMVGATGQQLRDEGRRYVESTQHFGDTAYGWAMEDRDGFCRLYADPDTGLLLGAHLMGYQASVLIQPLIQAMTFGQTVHELGRGQYWIHPALTEVVENALLKLKL